MREKALFHVTYDVCLVQRVAESASLRLVVFHACFEEKSKGIKNRYW